MPTSKSSNQEPGPDQRPPAIAIDAELAGRLVAALEQLGGAVASDRDRDERHFFGGTVDPVRARASRDYEVLRGMLGRADAPTPLRMRRQRSSGAGEPAVEQEGGERDLGYSDNQIVVDDPLPLSAKTAIVESPGDRSTSPVIERVPIRRANPVILPLFLIKAKQPISRVEIVDEKEKLVAFGPAFRPLPQPHDQPSGGR